MEALTTSIVALPCLIIVESNFLTAESTATLPQRSRYEGRHGLLDLQRSVVVSR
jgi:hypothetical protein